MLLLVLRNLLKTQIGLKNPAYRFIRHFLAAATSLLTFPAFFFLEICSCCIHTKLTFAYFTLEDWLLASAYIG